MDTIRESHTDLAQLQSVLENAHLAEVNQRANTAKHENPHNT